MTISASLITSATQPRQATTLLSSFSLCSRVISPSSADLTLSNLAVTGWKRLLLADSPRQTINALTLYAVYLVKKDLHGNWYDISKYFRGNSLSTSALTVTTLFTVIICAGSLLLLLVAAICYIPLLLHIRGNLKVRSLVDYIPNFCSLYQSQEYCCHKVDKVRPFVFHPCLQT